MGIMDNAEYLTLRFSTLLGSTAAAAAVSSAVRRETVECSLLLLLPGVLCKGE
jgi:hypothetical protein